MVELGVIQAVEEVDRTRPRSGETDAGLACELRVGAGHEGSHLLVADLDELRYVLAAAEGAHDPVDPIAGITVNTFHSPLGCESVEQVVGDGLTHSAPFSLPICVVHKQGARPRLVSGGENVGVFAVAML